jgi:endoglucanase
MPAIWDAQWAFVEEATGRAAVVGEWGGHYKSKDKVWQDAFADYIVDKCLEDTFYWCLNPNSGDTGGLLDYDFTTPMTDKLKLLDRVQPNPTFITSKGEGQLCIQPGAYANPKCDKGRRLQRA